MIKSLSKLNDYMKEDSNLKEKNVITFFFVPAGVAGVNKELIRNKDSYEDLYEEILDSFTNMKEKIMSSLITGTEITEDILLEQVMKQRINIKKKRFKRDKETPPLTSHNIIDEYRDAILNCLKTYKLLNKITDKVKIVYYPQYLTELDNLLELDYNKAVMVSDLSVFPSYYEPWGYTPLESLALSVPTITTDCAGFGRHVKNRRNINNPGAFVLERYLKNDEDVAEDLFDIFKMYVTLSKEDLIENKINSKHLSMVADWDILIRNYQKAYAIALNENE